MQLSPTHARAAACGLWFLGFVGVAGAVLTGHVKDVPYHAYLDAGRRWLAREPLYDLSNIDGFQYLPQAAAGFAQLARLNAWLAALIWRGLSWFGFTSGLWRLSRQLMPHDSERGFLIATALCVVAAANALGNGQANLALAALGLHTATALRRGLYRQASALLCLGLCLKPLMLVPLLVVVALYPPTRRAAALWLGSLAALPIVLAGPAYTREQYVSCARKLQRCAQPDRLFEDVRSLLWLLNVHCSERSLFAIRGVCALIVLAACARLQRHARPPLASSYVLSLCFAYLMLFNPRTLSTSYVMVAGFAGLLAAAHWHAGRLRLAAGFAGCALAWNINHHVVGGVQHWLNAVACMVFVALILPESGRAQLRERA